MDQKYLTFIDFKYDKDLETDFKGFVKKIQGILELFILNTRIKTRIAMYLYV